MKLDKPVSLFLERSATSHLRKLIQHSDQFSLTDDGEEAEAIIFENDKASYIRQTPEYQKWPAKCVVVSECDNPSYFLPGCYASNEICWLGKNRTRTIPYLISQDGFPNPYIKDISMEAARRYVYAFKGGATSWVRKRIFKNPPTHPDVLIQESNNYRHWNFETTYADAKSISQKDYAEILSQSSFFLCPLGVGSSSIRLYEVMQAGRVPVIISDNWKPIEGMKWSEFSIQVPEVNLSHLDRIIRENKHLAPQLGEKAKQTWMEYCAPGADTVFLANCIRGILAGRDEKRENLIHFVFPFFELKRNVSENGRSTMRSLILRMFALTGLKFPYSLNRPIK